jgi:hypothetical protein
MASWDTWLAEKDETRSSIETLMEYAGRGTGWRRMERGKGMRRGERRAEEGFGL